MDNDWKVYIVDTGGPGTGWPYVSSESEDRTVLGWQGFYRDYMFPGNGATLVEAKKICQMVADYMNDKG